MLKCKKNCHCCNLLVNPFAPGDFAEKRVLKLVEWFSCYKELKLTTNPFTGHTLHGLLIHEGLHWTANEYAENEPQKGRNSCLWLQTRYVLSSFGVLLMSCRVKFHVVRSALQYSACRIICLLLIQMQNISLRSSGMRRKQNFDSFWV